MLCRDNKFIRVTGLLLVMALCFPQMVLAAEANDGLDRAMQTFTQAMHSRDRQGVLAAFSRTTPWKYISFNGFTNKQDSQSSVTYAEMAREFKARKGFWYDKFMENRPTEHFRDEYFHGQKWLRQGNTFFANPKEPSGFFLKWRQEGGKWVIAEIGEYLT